MLLQEKADSLRFIKDNLEITLHLVDAINAIYGDSYLKDSLVLKGGTAVQMYLDDFSRLFFDLDMDYILDIEKKDEFRDRLLLEIANCGYDSFSLEKSRFSYSLDSYRFPYYLESGNLSYLKLEINYSYCVHLYEYIKKSVKVSDFGIESDVLLVNIEELLGLKMKALQDRGKVKDLYDIYYLMNSGVEFDFDKVKKAYLFYMVLADCQGMINNVDKISALGKVDVRRELYPLIKKKSSPNLEKMKSEVISFVKEASILSRDEDEFAYRFRDGIYLPENLFEGKVLVRARKNPIANWKKDLRNGNNIS